MYEGLGAQGPPEHHEPSPLCLENISRLLGCSFTASHSSIISLERGDAPSRWRLVRYFVGADPFSSSQPTLFSICSLVSMRPNPSLWVLALISVEQKNYFKFPFAHVKGQLNPRPVLRAFDFYLKSLLNSSHAMMLKMNNNNRMMRAVIRPTVVPIFI